MRTVGQPTTEEAEAGIELPSQREVDAIKRKWRRQARRLAMPLHLRHATDPWARRVAADEVIAHRDACAASIGVRLDRCLCRGEGFQVTRAPGRARLRWLLWDAMRSRPMRGGVRASFPQIAAATGCSHSTVIEALQMLARRPHLLRKFRAGRVA